MADEIEHRGRFQAQGSGVEESVPWARPSPPTQAEGHGMLDELRGMLTPPEQDHRELAFCGAHRFVDRAASGGGAHSPLKKSFPAIPRRNRRRVDVEVLKGLAFAPQVVEETDCR